MYSHWQSQPTDPRSRAEEREMHLYDHDSPDENYTRYYDDREMHQTPLTNYSPKPPDFDGSDEIDLNQFLDEIEDYEPLVIKDPGIMNQCMSFILKGYALKWFHDGNSGYYCGNCPPRIGISAVIGGHQTFFSNFD